MDWGGPFIVEPSPVEGMLDPGCTGLDAGTDELGELCSTTDARMTMQHARRRMLIIAISDGAPGQRTWGHA